MAELSPMMKKYMETKEEYKDCILFYRLGDFYEMFFEDATVAAKELELTLTGKQCGLEERAPMCGVPFHAVEGYINKLVSKGYKVAICEQVEDPRLAKGLVKREVTRVVTRGTNLDMQALEDTRNNFLMCISYVADSYGLAVCDITTGEFYTTQVDTIRKLLDEVYKYSPVEIICNEPFLLCGVDIDDLKYRLSVSIYPLEAWYFDEELCIRRLKEHFAIDSLNCFKMDEDEGRLLSSGALMIYLYETQKNSLTQIRTIKSYEVSEYMILDQAARRNLELTETIRDKQKKGSLLGVLDRTRTAMGARALRTMIEQPLIRKDMITERLDAVEALIKNAITREEIREYLNPVYDLERLMSRVVYKSANPRDILAFGNSVKMLLPIKQQLSDFGNGVLKKLHDELDTLEDLASLIESSISDEPPIQIKEGGIIREGYNETVDALRSAKRDGKSWLTSLEARDRERTGIKNLKIKYNRLFGYYFEVTRSYMELVPDDYIRKQTLANAERYTTDELKELEEKILNSEEKLFSLEYDLFCEIRDTLAENIDRIMKSASVIAYLDALASLAHVAEKNNYCRPGINNRGTIDIIKGRHPVVEQMISSDMFVSNDTHLDNKANRISIITGPNMAGKSTYMRQTALIVLMAQIGSFVPAKEADIGIVDRIFTRVGASDDLSSGQSTFMVEMTEVANILRNATSSSLLILDEIGRGTSTFDGLAIAWAVVEFVANPKLLGAKTLFATHYHELTELEGKLDSVNNYCIAVKEQGDNIVFLRKIVKGGADKSYGIQVAKLAGVPEHVTERAKEIVDELADNDITVNVRSIAEKKDSSSNRRVKRLDEVDLNQMSLFDTVTDDDIINELKGLDLDNMTPMDALNTLSKIKNKLTNRWGY